MKETDAPMETHEYIENATLDGMGHITPSERQRARLPELLQRLDEAYKYVDKPYLVPCMCMNGRCIHREASDTRPDGPTAAGGTLTITVGRDLAGFGYDYIASDFASLHYELASELHDNGYPVGSHCKNLAALHDGDRTIDNMTTGCGATDHIADIYAVLRDHSADLAQFAGVCDITISSQTIHAVSSATARRLNDKNWMPNPDENGLRLVMDELNSVDPTGLVELEPEQHAECAIVINTQQHSTIDRNHLREMFADPDDPEFRMDIFSVDLWAIAHAAMAFEPRDEMQRAQLYESMLLFNLATAYVLCGRGMPVIIR